MPENPTELQRPASGKWVEGELTAEDPSVVDEKSLKDGSGERQQKTISDPASPHENRGDNPSGRPGSSGLRLFFIS